MSTKCTEKANRYFSRMTKKVYVEECTKIESFEEYLNHRYRDNCYYYSAFACMGLKPEDFVVRGDINLDGRKYHHGWVEFEFEKNEYVFDPMIKGVTLKEEWYKKYNPRVDYKKTQREILDEYLNERCAFKITEGLWQFKPIVMNTDTDDISYYEMITNDQNNGHIPFALALARISEYNSEIIRFIAYA